MDYKRWPEGPTSGRASAGGWADAKIDVMASLPGEIEEARTPAPSTGSRLAARLRQDAPFFLVAALVVAADQATKAIVRASLAVGESWPEGWLVKFTHVTNSGAAFGVLQGQGLFLTVTAFVAIAAILFYYLFPPLEHGFLRLALALQLGGAVGNLADRLRFGEVTDFIDFPRYPQFNIADSSIVIGLAVIVGFFVLRDGDKKERRDAE
jgi:signal peptidase II